MNQGQPYADTQQKQRHNKLGKTDPIGAVQEGNVGDTKETRVKDRMKDNHQKDRKSAQAIDE
jgi:hypothetical protein